MRNERIVFMGTPEFAANILEGLIKNEYNIVGVVTQADKKVGRKQILTPTPVKEMALKYGLPVFQPAKIRDDHADILALNPDLIITSAYGQIIPKDMLEFPKYRCINTHGSLLPKYRGGSPIQTAIINGEEFTGMTIMYMEEKMDAGAILFQKKMKIEENDTNATMFAKLSDLALKMLLEFLPGFFAGDFVQVEQIPEEVTFSYNLKKEDEFIHFNRDVKTVYNHIRGLLDNPGAFAILNGKTYKLMKVGYQKDDLNNLEDSIFMGLFNDHLRISCLNGYIEVYEIKPEGKNTMDARSFFNGSGRNLVNQKFNREM